MTAAPTSTALDLRAPASFDFWTDVSIRFSDQDSNQHVNNTAFAVYAEAGRVAYLVNLRKHLGITAMSVLASVRLSYINQLFYPGMVKVGTRLTRLGGKSYTLSQGLFAGDQVVATAESDLVWYDFKINRSVPVPDVLRHAFDGGLPLTSGS